MILRIQITPRVIETNAAPTSRRPMGSVQRTAMNCGVMMLIKPR